MEIREDESELNGGGWWGAERDGKTREMKDEHS